MVAEWMFIGWIPQIISAINFNRECYLDSLFLRIAHAYPAAVYNPFHLSLEQYKNNLTVDEQNNRKFICDILAIIRNPLAEKFNDAMKHLCVPETKLTYHLTNLLGRLVNGPRQLKTNEIWVKSIQFIVNTVYERRRYCFGVDAEQFNRLFVGIDRVENRIKNLKTFDGKL